MTVERTREDSANRRRAEKRIIWNQKRGERRNRVNQFHHGSDSIGMKGGTTNFRWEQTGNEMTNDLVRMVRDRPSELFQDIRNRIHTR